MLNVPFPMNEKDETLNICGVFPVFKYILRKFVFSAWRLKCF